MVQEAKKCKDKFILVVILNRPPMSNHTKGMVMDSPKGMYVDSPMAIMQTGVSSSVHLSCRGRRNDLTRPVLHMIRLVRSYSRGGKARGLMWLPSWRRILVDVIFGLATKNAPAIIFIDDVDAIATACFDAQTGADREVQRILMELLNQLYDQGNLTTKLNFLFLIDGKSGWLFRFIRPEDIPVQYGGLSRPTDVLTGPPIPASEFNC